MTSTVKQAEITHCWIDLPRCQLIIGKGSDQTQVGFDLPAQNKSKQPKLKMSERGLGALDAETFASRMESWEIDINRYGLSLDEKAYLYKDTHGLPPAYYFETRQLIFPGAYHMRTSQGPYDLFVSSNLAWLAVVNRRDADVLIFDIAQQELIAQHTFEMLKPTLTKPWKIYKIVITKQNVKNYTST